MIVWQFHFAVTPAAAHGRLPYIPAGTGAEAGAAGAAVMLGVVLVVLLATAAFACKLHHRARHPDRVLQDLESLPDTEEDSDRHQPWR